MAGTRRSRAVKQASRRAEPAWTSRRCQSILRPLTAHVQALRQAYRPTAGDNASQHDAILATPKQKSAGPESECITLPTPYLTRGVSAVTQEKAQVLPTVPIAERPTRQKSHATHNGSLSGKAYDCILKTLTELKPILSASDCPPHLTQTTSLLYTCLEQLPQVASRECYRRRQLDPDDKSDVLAEVLTHLEDLSSVSTNGWPRLSHVVQHQQIWLCRTVFHEGLLDHYWVDLLLAYCISMPGLLFRFLSDMFRSQQSVKRCMRTLNEIEKFLASCLPVDLVLDGAIPISEITDNVVTSRIQKLLRMLPKSLPKLTGILRLAAALNDISDGRDPVMTSETAIRRQKPLAILVRLVNVLGIMAMSPQLSGFRDDECPAEHIGWAMADLAVMATQRLFRGIPVRFDHFEARLMYEMLFTAFMTYMIGRGSYIVLPEHVCIADFSLALHMISEHLTALDGRTLLSRAMSSLDDLMACWSLKDIHRIEDMRSKLIEALTIHNSDHFDQIAIDLADSMRAELAHVDLQEVQTPHTKRVARDEVRKHYEWESALCEWIKRDDHISTAAHCPSNEPIRATRQYLKPTGEHCIDVSAAPNRIATQLETYSPDVLTLQDAKVSDQSPVRPSSSRMRIQEPLAMSSPLAMRQPELRPPAQLKSIAQHQSCVPGSQLAEIQSPLPAISRAADDQMSVSERDELVSSPMAGRIRPYMGDSASAAGLTLDRKRKPTIATTTNVTKRIKATDMKGHVQFTTENENMENELDDIDELA